MAFAQAPVDGNESPGLSYAPDHLSAVASTRA